MNHLVWPCIAGFLFSSASAQSPVSYQIAFGNAVHHEATISATFRELGDAPLELRMSRSSPGRYALHEFAKNVYAMSAVDGAGRAL
jgi:predicted metalloprotease with PDZ domain